MTVAWPGELVLILNLATGTLLVGTAPFLPSDTAERTGAVPYQRL